MARILQLRKGTTQENNIFIGSEAELTYNTETKGLIIHDGLEEHRGGFQVPVVVAYKTPTQDDPSWHRVYSDGWVEQGGRIQNNQTGDIRINLTYPMENAYFYKNAFFSSTNTNPKPIYFKSHGNDHFIIAAESYHDRIYWEAKGKKA